MKKALTIAGSDPSAGAGIQLDLKIFERLGVYGMTVISALTAQNTEGVQKVADVAPRIVAAQIDSVMRDIGADACKIGMLHSPTVVDTVAERIVRRKIPNVVLDPVLAASDGTLFASPRAVKRIRKLIGRVLVVTPNISEAELLSKVRIESLADVRRAAERILEFGCRYVLVKGGHLPGEPVDVLCDGTDCIEMPGERVDGPPVHGTGCALSAAMAARLALGDTVPEAARFAKEFVRELIGSAIGLGRGSLLIP
ncbi:MAG: bifunctional hydroxymethylpyrimidine kinase/phosphomethylpyrimidine kinase [Armatimonadota bacterium]